MMRLVLLGAPQGQQRLPPDIPTALTDRRVRPRAAASCHPAFTGTSGGGPRRWPVTYPTDDDALARAAELITEQHGAEVWSFARIVGALAWRIALPLRSPVTKMLARI